MILAVALYVPLHCNEYMVFEAMIALCQAILGRGIYANEMNF